MPETVLYEKTGTDNHVAIITLNRPESSNAINRQLRRELRDVIDHFDNEDDEAWSQSLPAPVATSVPAAT